MLPRFVMLWNYSVVRLVVELLVVAELVVVQLVVAELVPEWLWLVDRIAGTGIWHSQRPFVGQRMCERQEEVVVVGWRIDTDCIRNALHPLALPGRQRSGSVRRVPSAASCWEWPMVMSWE